MEAARSSTTNPGTAIPAAMRRRLDMRRRRPPRAVDRAGDATQWSAILILGSRGGMDRAEATGAPDRSDLDKAVAGRCPWA
jgi:hypothetical protein